MKKEKNLLIVIVTGALSVLTGCDGDTSTDVVRTVDWYKTHEKERVEMLAKCQNNPGQLVSTPNCMNAQQADVKSPFSGTKGIKVEPLKFK